jgi:DNA-binding GntR family transcriptional regulator
MQAPLGFSTKTNYATEALRAAIRTGEVQPGERLILEALAEKWGISATPLREAVHRLEAEGLVRSTPHRGVRVARTTAEQALETYLVLGALEGLAARMGALAATPEVIRQVETIHRRAAALLERQRNPDLRRVNREFHTTLYRSAGMAMLLEMIERLHAKSPWDTLQIIPGRPQESFAQHEAILAALRAGDAQAVGRLTTEHVESVAESVAAYIREQDRLEQDQDGSAARRDVPRRRDGGRTRR